MAARRPELTVKVPGHCHNCHESEPSRSGSAQLLQQICISPITFFTPQRKAFLPTQQRLSAPLLDPNSNQHSHISCRLPRTISTSRPHIVGVTLDQLRVQDPPKQHQIVPQQSKAQGAQVDRDAMARLQSETSTNTPFRTSTCSSTAHDLRPHIEGVAVAEHELQRQAVVDLLAQRAHKLEALPQTSQLRSRPAIGVPSGCAVWPPGTR